MDVKLTMGCVRKKKARDVLGSKGNLHAEQRRVSSLSSGINQPEGKDCIPKHFAEVRIAFRAQVQVTHVLALEHMGQASTGCAGNS